MPKFVADSAEATGLKWAAPAAAGFQGCALIDETSQTISNNTFTALTFGTETFDIGGYHSTVSNTSRITIPSGKGGYYLIYVFCTTQSNGTGERLTRIYKNGSYTSSSGGIASTTNGRPSISFTILSNLSAADYIEVFVYQNSGGNLNYENNYFGVQYLGA